MFIVCIGIYKEETIENTIEILEMAINTYGKPEEILTDHGTQFFSNSKKGIRRIRINFRISHCGVSIT